MLVHEVERGLPAAGRGGENVADRAERAAVVALHALAILRMHRQLEHDGGLALDDLHLHVVGVGHDRTHEVEDEVLHDHAPWGAAAAVSRYFLIRRSTVSEGR